MSSSSLKYLLVNQIVLYYVNPFGYFYFVLLTSYQKASIIKRVSIYLLEIRSYNDSGIASISY